MASLFRSADALLARFAEQHAGPTRLRDLAQSAAR
jgi:hypothetical protein